MLTFKVKAGDAFHLATADGPVAVIVERAANGQARIAVDAPDSVGIGREDESHDERAAREIAASHRQRRISTNV